MTQFTAKQPRPDVVQVQTDGAAAGKMTLPLQQWVQAVHALLFGLANGSNIGPLTNAANDGAAAAAGVPVGGLYRNGNAVQIRLV